jgi:hypothetical protein
VEAVNPKRAERLIGKNGVPMIGFRSADLFQFAFEIVGIIGKSTS